MGLSRLSLTACFSRNYKPAMKSLPMKIYISFETVSYRYLDSIISFQEEGWVVCRVFKKKVTAIRRLSEHESPCWYDEQTSFMPDIYSPKRIAPQPDMAYHQHLYSCKPELELHHLMPHDPFHQLSQLESPKLPNYVNHGCALQPSSIVPEDPTQPSHQLQIISIYNCSGSNDLSVEQVTDWRVLDKFVASQLSHDDVSKEPNYSSSAQVFQVSDKEKAPVEYASTSTSSGQIDLWK